MQNVAEWALPTAIRPGEREITVDLKVEPPVDDIVELQCRQRSLKGTGEISLRRLEKESPRLRPDGLVVGEVREAEALDPLALDCGVPELQVHYSTRSMRHMDCIRAPERSALVGEAMPRAWASSIASSTPRARGRAANAGRGACTCCPGG